MGGRLTERERIKANVRVIVNESTPPSGESLRSILEADGFEVVGTASSPEELRHLLTVTDPQVVVFDAGTGVTAVAETRAAAPTAGLVVVWPAGVTASVADLKVEPWRAEFDLGKAVRAACVRHAPVREPMTVPKAAPVLVTSAIEPIEPESAPALLPAGAVARTRQPDPVARRRANLALLFAAASLAVVVLMFSAQLAVRRISPPGGLARPGLTQGPDVVAAGQGETANLVENPIALPTATAFLLTRSISGGLAVQPSPSGASGATGISSSSGNSHGTGHVVRSHGGGSATRGPNGGGSPGGGSGQPQGRPAGANGGGGGGNSGSPSHGQSGLSHGKSSQSHGHSGLSHGKSSQSHGHSAQSHGHSGH